MDNPPEVETANIRYLYLDIVAFSKDRSVEAQSDIIARLNTAVSSALLGLNVPEDKRILLPTGDGMCIALIEMSKPFDIHIQMARIIIWSIHQHNESTSDEMRRFKVRIGINENLDNLVIDVNGHRNVAGAGINMAQRVMNTADGNQIIVSQSVFDQMQAREKYMKSFRRFDAVAKHNVRMSVYQYTDETIEGLDINVPQGFLPETPEPRRLSRFAAHYFAHAIQKRRFFFERKEVAGLKHAGMVFLYYLAHDSVEALDAGDYGSYLPETWGATQASIKDQFAHYTELDFAVCVDFASFIAEKYLEPFSNCFEYDGVILRHYVFVNDFGKQKLQNEYPDLCVQFGLGTDMIEDVAIEDSGSVS